jgi:hypothetical protein
VWVAARLHVHRPMTVPPSVQDQRDDVDRVKIDVGSLGTHHESMTEVARTLLGAFQQSLGDPMAPVSVNFSDGGSLPSVFAVSDLAQSSMGVAGAALAALVAVRDGGIAPGVAVDRDLASAWFLLSIRPQDWSLPPPWDAVAGDYVTADGWVKLHTNAARHRAAALSVLGVPADRAAVSAAVRTWTAADLEGAVVSAGGAAAAMRSITDWKRHPQGRAVASEPLLHCQRTSLAARASRLSGGRDRPLAGLRVLDLTRVLAGPVATRLLAGWGAEVLRIDPPDWDEPALVPEVTLGKRCARIDLRTPGGKDCFLNLLSTADVLVHGYRSDALSRLGLGEEVRDEVRPGLVDVTLDAYGWTGPWVTRRGFDSLVQMSAGIADAGRLAVGTDRPVPLPVQALDHATGYLVAAAVIAGVTVRHVDGRGSRWRTSLARMAAQLIDAGLTDMPDGDDDLPTPPVPGDAVELTSWGKALRLPSPMIVTGAPLSWPLPARPRGADQARWHDD